MELVNFLAPNFCYGLKSTLMKVEEQMAKTYLEHLEYQDIVFEPDGNIPPDLLLNGNIALEVRRFNQYFRNGDKKEALENLD